MLYAAEVSVTRTRLVAVRPYQTSSATTARTASNALRVMPIGSLGSNTSWTVSAPLIIIRTTLTRPSPKSIRSGTCNAAHLVLTESIGSIISCV